MVTFLVGLFGSVAISSSITPTYRSDVRIYVTATTVDQSNAYALGLYSEQRIASYADLAKDPALLGRVIRQVGLNITAEELASRVTATPVPSSVILQVSVTDSDPEMARTVARAEANEIVKLVASLEAPGDDSKSGAPAPVVARVAGDASFDGFPVSPNIPLNVIIGALLGLLFGIAGAVVRDLFDVSIKSPSDAAEASGASVMAVIPYDSSVPKRPLISDQLGASERVDAFSVLRTNLQYVDLDTKHQVLVVSSALPEEGKTVTSANLALAIAKTGRRVLIVDCDFRRPRVAKVFGLENSVGLLTVLVGRASLEECIQQHALGVDFLATGPQPPNPAEVLETQAMTDLLERLRGLYDVVIIDAPPLLPVADPALIAGKADGVLLVVRHGKTSHEAVRHAVDRIENVGSQIVGVVLNMTPRRAMSGYGYGYGYGYGEVEWPKQGAGATGKRTVANGRRPWRAKDRVEVSRHTR